VGSLPPPKFGNKLNAETEILVQSLYEDNEYSRMLPGVKDYVSIFRNVVKQKRLLFCNLRELYSEFKLKHMEVKTISQSFVNFGPNSECLQAQLAPTMYVYAPECGPYVSCCQAKRNVINDLYDIMVK
jgi:hypothetical protein